MKNVQGNATFLYLIVPLYVPNCGMLELLYEHNITFLLMYLSHSAIGILRIRVLNVLSGIRLPLLPVSVFQSSTAVFG